MSSSLLNTIAFNGGYSIGTPLRSELREAFGTHQVLIQDYKVPRGTTKRIPPEMTPLIYKWGISPATIRTFNGYVNHHEILDGANTSILRVFSLGTSLTLNNPNPRSWTRVSASYIAREVGGRHGLRVVLHKSPEILPYWTQGNETDFVMLQRLANRTGFRFWIDGSTLFFLDPRRLVRTPNLNDLQVFTKDKKSTDTLYSLNTISGSLAPQDGVLQRSEVYGIDSKSGGLIKATSDKTLSDLGYDQPSSTTISGYAVDTPFEARRIAQAAVATGTWVTETAHVISTSKPRLGDVVRLDGSALPTGSDGLWLVSGSTQVIEVPLNQGSRLTTVLQLTRDQKDDLTYRTSSTLRAPAVVPPVLRNTGLWESQVLEDVYV